MILDRIAYAQAYTAQLPNLPMALERIRQEPDMDGSRHFFPGGYVMRQTGITKPIQDASFESHRKYIDVFILAQGAETVIWNRIEEMEPVAEYDPEKDKLALKGTGASVQMLPGMFCALFPTDAHSPCRHPDGQDPSPYVKYVVKLEL